MDHLEKSGEVISTRSRNNVLGQIDNGSSVYLAQRINFLKRKKLELARRLNMLEQQLEEESDVNTNDPRVESAINKLEELKNIVLAYRLTGISLFSVENRKIVICFDSSWKNQFCSSDYVELIQKSDGSLALGRYTLPCFVPVAELADKHLLNDPRKFVSCISDHLFAWVTRREEIKILKIIYEDSQDWVKIESTEPVDYVNIQIGTSEDPVNLKIEILYKDMLQTLPSDAHCLLKEKADMSPECEVEEQTIHQWEEQLNLLPLSKVLPDIIGTLLSKNLVNTNVSSQGSNSSQED